jgi:membrane protein involved in colicin uptake
MKSVVKKIAIYSMIGIMQIGFGASVIEASPLQNDPSPMQQRFDRPGQRQGWHERERIENERHEREMKRRPHETRKQWRERQKHENERHERELYKIRQHRYPWHP